MAIKLINPDKQSNLLLALAAAWCFAMVSPAHSQLETRPTPMWEGVEKTASDIDNDKNLVKQALELSNGDPREAALSMAQSGWQQIGNGQPNDAIRRFNLAWLVKPDLPDIFWGFAVAAHIRGDDVAAVQKLFDGADGAFDQNPQFLTDRGRVLEEREMPNEARVWFEKALALNEGYAPAHFGMMRVGMALEDKELEDKHRTRFEALMAEQNQ